MIANRTTDVVVIGAGPAGAIAACLLRQQGHQVVVLEKSTFPRFVIGESLLPQCLQTLKAAGCLEAVNAAGFQRKVGANFQHRGHYEQINFADMFAAGPSHAFHVLRSEFDDILAQCAVQAGATVEFNATVTAAKNQFNDCLVAYTDADGNSGEVRAKFILDASGYGRVLPRLLDIDQPSSLEPKASFFTHVDDGILPEDHQRDATLITTHPKHRNVWYWLISFASGRSSVGVVGPPELIEPYQGEGMAGLKKIIHEDPELAHILRHAEFDSQAHQINAYSGNVTQFCGDGYAVLGNAGEFLDPIFSSGVTVAMKSAHLATTVLDKQLNNEPHDWEQGFVEPLKMGIETFKTFVTHWYSGGFQDVIYSPASNQNVKAKIASILAGYAWDTDNPYVLNPEDRLQTLIEICQQ